jgi:O-antigen polymerase
MTDRWIEVPTGRREPFWQRILLIAGISAYVALFQWMYEYYLYPTWDYFGFHYEPPPTIYLVLAWILSVTPSLWMPIRLTRPSQLAYWVLYVTVFIPSMFVPFYAGLDAPKEISLLLATIYTGFAIMGNCYRVPLLRLDPTRISWRAFWKGFGLVAAVLAIWMLVVFRGHMQFLSFNNIYDLREIQNDVSEGTLVNFAFMLLTGAFNPFLMGCGLFYRRKLLFLTGVFGQLLVYIVGGTKGSILSIAFISGFYVLFRFGRHPFALKLLFGTVALAGGLCASYALSGYDPEPLKLHWVALFVVLMRTFSSNGLMTAWYFNFFQSNPHTFYSHVRGVNWFVHFPYERTAALEIGSVYMGGNDADPTAHFWAIDGIGALGLPGVLLISVFCGLVFWALDSAAQRHDPRLAALVTCYAAYNIANISIFTSLYSGGLAVLILSLYLMPPKTITRLKDPALAANYEVCQAPRSGALPIQG